MRRRKKTLINRQQIQLEMQYFFEHGGKIEVLPPQVYAPLNRVNCASPYIDYRDHFDELSSPAILQK